MLAVRSASIQFEPLLLAHDAEPLELLVRPDVTAQRVALLARALYALVASFSWTWAAARSARPCLIELAGVDDARGAQRQDRAQNDDRLSQCGIGLAAQASWPAHTPGLSTSFDLEGRQLRLLAPRVRGAATSA